MKAATKFLARVSNGRGEFPFASVQIKRDRPIIPEGARSYYARYTNGKRRVTQPLGKNIETAYAQFLNIDLAQKQIRAGQEPTITVSTIDNEESLADAIDQFLDDSKAVGNAKDTVESKTRILRSFQKVAADRGVVTVKALKDPQVARKILLDYLQWMRTNLRKQKVDGVRQDNTYHKRLSRIGTFLKQHGIKVKKERVSGPDDKGILRHEEHPKYKSREATKYSPGTIRALLKVASEDEADLIQFFLFTGFRDEEAAHVEWSDLNFTDRSINVHTKAQTAVRPWSWKPKDDEPRSVDIPLSKEFVDRMRARQKRHASHKCALIFPSAACKPDGHLLRRVRIAAERAGITQPITLHKFRRTFGSYMAKAYGIEMARQCLGHSKIETTHLYLAADGDDAKEARETIGAVQAEYIAISS